MSAGVDVLIVCALPEELDALREVSEGVLEPWTPVPGDPPYLSATLDGAKGPVRVAAARPTRPGGSATAALATKLVTRLGPRSLAMCGVCAGHPVLVIGFLIIWDRIR